MKRPLTIWSNGVFKPEAARLLEEGTRRHRLVIAESASAAVLVPGRRSATLADADIALGQPAVADCLEHGRLRWLEVTSAGYTRYDTPEFREAFTARGAALTTMSGVFADPCAQHVLGMMLALARQIPASLRAQLTDRDWAYETRRYDSFLLTGQTVLLLGFGAIGRRLAELLAPFRMRILAVRRQVRSERGVTILPEERLTAALAEADHVVNLLPANEGTRNYVNARRLAAFKQGARFYNVGRGTTVDQAALLEALREGRLGGAFLDVFDPEPLPPDDPLWSAPGCHITPHTAGGFREQDEAIIRHFLRNLEAFERGEPLDDRVV
jgi:phosphoglycerate dehydrogenase-like enzyme